MSPKKNGKADVGTVAAMTDKMTRFVEEYLIDFNATQAAVRAGYSERTAHVIGWENLRKPNIREAVKVRLAELTMSSAEAAMRLTAWGRGSLDPFLTATGHIDLTTADAQANLHLLKKVKRTQGQHGENVEIELHDPKDAVIQMAKLHGMFKDDGKESEAMTPERRLELWDAIQRIKSVEEFERMLVAAAQKQIGSG